jgi:transcriptional regulator with XRE-family HTH domain
MDRIELGARLRGLRNQRGLSLTELEAATAISSSFLSMVESGKSDITISRLVRLADYFEVDLADLVEAGRRGRRPLEVIRAGEGSILASSSEGVTVRFLGHSRWQLSPRVTEYEPGGEIAVFEGDRISADLLAHHEVFLYVEAGTFEVMVRGEDPVRVSRGDAILVNDGADRVVNIGSDRGRLIVVGVAIGPARPA